MCFNEIFRQVTLIRILTIEMKETKTEFRNKAKEILEAASEEYRQSASVSIALNALALPEMYKAKHVLLYFSVGSEPSTLALIQKLLEAGKKVYLPRCTDFDSEGSKISDEHTMEARQINSLDHLMPGAYGIPEPVADDRLCPVVKGRKIDLVLLPCLACGPDCSRLGHGAGYYDRYLSELKRGCFKAALCYDKLIMDGIPMDRHDVYMDAVITERTIYRQER